MFRIVSLLGALALLPSAAAIAAEPSNTVQASFASWCRDRAPAGYEVLPCPPDPCNSCPKGDRVEMRWVEEVWEEVCWVQVPVPVTEQRTITTYQRQDVTRKEAVTTYVPVDRSEIVQRKIQVPEQQTVQVPVTRYETHTECVTKPEPVTRRYRYVQCEPDPCCPGMMIPKVYRGCVTEMELRTRRVTTSVPVTELQQRTITQWHTQTINVEVKRRDWEARTEMRDVSRPECVPVQKTVEVQGCRYEWKKQTVTRRCLRAVYVKVDDCGMPIAPPPQQSAPPPPPSPAPAKTMARETSEAPTASFAVWRKNKE